MRVVGAKTSGHGVDPEEGGERRREERRSCYQVRGQFQSPPLSLKRYDEAERLKMKADLLEEFERNKLEAEMQAIIEKKEPKHSTQGLEDVHPGFEVDGAAEFLVLGGQFAVKFNELRKAIMRLQYNLPKFGRHPLKSITQLPPIPPPTPPTQLFQ